MPPVIHPLAPVFDAHSRVLILGTMPSPKSREQGFYYGHPQNRFWPTLAAVLGVSPAPVSVEARRAMALDGGVALWDVLSRCEIEGAADSSIRNPVPNDIAGLLAQTSICALFTTGQTAFRLYRQLCLPQAGFEPIVLPSPSPANCACSLERLVREYRAMLPFLLPPAA
ncbi:MAG: DNA-deoxyinosine glycosylase, partial [Oscillospiraceae bacterium]